MPVGGEPEVSGEPVVGDEMGARIGQRQTWKGHTSGKSRRSG